MTSGSCTRAGFDIDLRFGQEREGAFGKLLASSGDSVEIKSDQKCRRTGNLFVEYEQKGRPSGVSTTTASFWAFEFDDDCWVVVPTERLRLVARQAYRDESRRVLGGDFNRYRGVLVRIADLVRPRLR